MHHADLFAKAVAFLQSLDTTDCGTVEISDSRHFVMISVHQPTADLVREVDGSRGRIDKWKSWPIVTSSRSTTFLGWTATETTFGVDLFLSPAVFYELTADGFFTQQDA